MITNRYKPYNQKLPGVSYIIFFFESYIIFKSVKES